MTYEEFFTGKKVTMMGLGLLGRGVGDAVFIAQHGAKEVIVTDMKGEAELAESVAALEGHPNIRFKLGGHDERDFTDADMVIKAAGVPLDSSFIAAAQRAGVPVHMSTALAAKFAAEAGARILGVTGTRGKSTVAHMIHHSLAAAGKRTHLGGNIRGISTLALLPSVRAGDILVLELDSWQLQGFGYEQFSPHVAVFTNLMPDHQNYYPDMDSYFADKANIFKYQKGEDVLVATYEVEQLIHEKGKLGNGRIVHADMNQIVGWDLRIPGNHNRQNAACAVQALIALGMQEDEIRTNLAMFEAVSGRLELMREIDGVKFYNDTTATTPDALYAGAMAIAALAKNKEQIVIIAGGTDKKLPIPEEKMREVNRIAEKIILLPGTGTDRVRHLLEKRVSETSSLEAAVQEAKEYLRDGGYVLFSPGFTSFGMFKNEYDRGDQFVQAVESL